MSPERILLIVPPTGRYIREDRCQTPIEKLKTVALRPPIDLLYAAASFERAGCACRVVDFPAKEKSWEHLENLLREFRPAMIVLSITTPSLPLDVEAARQAKTILPGILTVAKGAHFNTLDLHALEQYPQLDVALRGEYEQTCRELGEGRPLAEIHGITWRAPDGALRRNPDRALMENLDELPFPARHLVHNELYIRPDTGEPQTTIVTNRGCPFSCIFCLANQVAGRKNRTRSQENILAEIEECVYKFGIRNFLFRSDLFTASKEWVIGLCEKITGRGLGISWACNSRVDTIDREVLRAMKRAGCWLIAYGVESGDQATLDRMNKRTDLNKAREALRMTREEGLCSSIYFLFGMPWDDQKVFDADLRFAREINPDFIEIFYVYPFPGTKLYEIAVAEGLLKEGEIPAAAYDSPAMPTLHVGIDELTKWRRRFLRRFYMRPGYIFRTISRIRSPRVLWNYMKYGVRQMLDLLRPG